MASLLAFAQSPYSSTILSDKFVAYYRLGEAPGATVAADSSGNGKNVTYEGSPILGVNGLITDPANTTVSFINGDVVVPDAPDLDFVDAPFTIEA